MRGRKAGEEEVSGCRKRQKQVTNTQATGAQQTLCRSPMSPADQSGMASETLGPSASRML